MGKLKRFFKEHKFAPFFLIIFILPIINCFLFGRSIKLIIMLSKATFVMTEDWLYILAPIGTVVLIILNWLIAPAYFDDTLTAFEYLNIVNMLLIFLIVEIVANYDIYTLVAIVIYFFLYNAYCMYYYKTTKNEINGLVAKCNDLEEMLKREREYNDRSK